MMGAPVGRQDRLFYEFDLEEMVPADHLLRKIDAVLDLSWLRRELSPYYSHGDENIAGGSCIHGLEKVMYWKSTI